MSARTGTSRLETVRRVAELRATAARAAVGAATQRTDLARRLHEERVAGLSALAFGGGGAGTAHAALRSGLARAQDAADAGREHAERDDERRRAVAGWADATRRARLLDDVCARHRAEHAAAAETRTQHLLDDLAGRTKERTA